MNRSKPRRKPSAGHPWNRTSLAEINRGLRAIQRSIRAAKQDPAWKFGQGANRIAVEKRVRRDLEESIAGQRSLLWELKHTLDDWSRPWRAPMKRAKKPQKPGKPSPPKSRARPPFQTEFGF